MEFEELKDSTKEEIEARLMLSVINYTDNVRYLASCPVVQKGDFALYTQVCIGEKNDYGLYTACVSVTEEMRQGWGINRNELFSIAAENSKVLFPGEIKPLSEFANRTEDVILPDGNAVPEVYVLSNQFHFNGAATLFYQPELLDQLGEKLKKDHFVLMPTGVNEVYCIASNGKPDLMGYQVLFDEVLESVERHSALSRNVMDYEVKSQMVEEIGGDTYTLDVDDTPQFARGKGR